MEVTNLKEYRCYRCNRKLFVATLGLGSEISIKCGKCGSLNLFDNNGLKLDWYKIGLALYFLKIKHNFLPIKKQKII